MTRKQCQNKSITIAGVMCAACSSADCWKVDASFLDLSARSYFVNTFGSLTSRWLPNMAAAAPPLAEWSASISLGALHKNTGQAG
jgi:hypothetical protein